MPKVVAAFATFERTQAGTGAQMRDDHPALGQIGRFRGKPPGDIFIGQAMKAIAPNTDIADRARQGKVAGFGGQGVMKGGVKTGKLRHVGARIAHRTDGIEIMRHVDGIKRDQRFKSGQQRGRDQCGGHMRRATMDDPVAHRAQIFATGDSLDNL